MPINSKTKISQFHKKYLTFKPKKPNANNYLILWENEQNRIWREKNRHLESFGKFWKWMVMFL